MTIFIPGYVVPWARAARGRGHSYTPAAQADYKKKLVDTLRYSWFGPQLEMARVDILVLRARPARLRGPPGRAWYPGVPDRDNFDKMALDAIQEAGIVANDSRVVCGTIAKMYAAADEAEGLEITIQAPGRVEPWGRPRP